MTNFYDKLLLFHLIHEFTYGNVSKKILSETRGVVPNIDNIVKTFVSNIGMQIYSAFNDENYFSNVVTSEYTEKEIPLPKDCFFNQFYLKISIEKNNKVTYHGGMYPIKSFIINKSGDGFVFRPYIVLHIEGESIQTVVNKLSIALSHELTHAYDYYMYFQKNGFPQSVDDIEKSGTKRFTDAMRGNHSIERVVGSINYRLSQKEMNAFLGQLKIELNNQADKIQDAKSAFDAIKKTDSFYSTYMYLKNEIETLIYDVEDVDMRKEIIKYTNSVAEKKFTNYDQVKKYYFNRWYKWSEKYLTKASKIAFDVFAENSDIGGEGDFTGSFSLKKNV